MEEQILTAPEQQELPATVTVVDVQFRPGQKVYYIDPAGMTYNTGDHIIIDTARGPEFGICAGGNHEISSKDIVSPLRGVIRLATAQDEKTVAENRAKERRAHEICLQKIAEHGLDMQLVSAEYAFDGSKILFFFTADERVDFRELVKNLASIFHTRIELRQIGVRDKAKMVGGLGICGRPFCCASFLDDFQPVSIKMAKTQNLSLNPTKISGTCGRLMCCLKYEQDAYEDLIRNSPKMDSFVDTPEGRGTIVEVDLLRSRVKVRMEDAPETIAVFANADIAVLRSGKAKRGDAPIPADLAPISGSGKRVRKEEKEEPALTLDPIKFRYSTETVVDEEPQQEIPPQEAEAVETPHEENKPNNRNRRNRSRRPENKPAAQPGESKPENKSDTKPENKGENKPKDKPKKPQPKPQENKEPKQSKVDAPAEAPAAEGEQPAKKKSGHRRPYYHHRRKSKQGGEGSAQ